jgi:WD40 repeat protein/transcriptional regulator with XRE-family HTH domain
MVNGYKQRDYRFADPLIRLRKRAGLAQQEVANRIGVSEKTIRNWEGAINYPTEYHLKQLIELYLHYNAFVSRCEQEEARQLWDQLRTSVNYHISAFDDLWFSSVLEIRQTHRANCPALSSRNPPRDWGGVLNVPNLYGREHELEMLRQWVLSDDGCRLVTVLGMGGIGKTALVLNFVRQIAPNFACVVWQSLHNAPPLEDLLHDWISALAEPHNLAPVPEIDQAITLLITLLQDRRCLLVLDNVETLFQEGMPEGRFCAGYEAYEKLIGAIAQKKHHGCLVLTSRALPAILRQFTGSQEPGRVLRLGGLTENISQQLLKDKGLHGNDETWNDFVQRYAGNPLILKIVAEIIHRLYGGDITSFLSEEFMTFSSIRELLTQQFKQLSKLEQALMYWLAVEREPVTQEHLRNDLCQPFMKEMVAEALLTLYNRSLLEIEQGEHTTVFLLQPVILAYVTDQLVERVGEEICTEQLELFLHHALLQGQTKEYLRLTQERIILQPLLKRLQTYFKNQQTLSAHLEHLLVVLRGIPLSNQGYGSGNLINLLVQVRGHLQELDMSQLSIRGAYLQQTETQSANFAGSNLTDALFMEPCEGILSVAFSPDERFVAAGSNSGQLSLWRIVDSLIVFMVQAHIKLTWMVAFSPDSRFLASGGYEGDVKIWETNSGRCVKVLQGHTAWVRALTWSPDGHFLVSGGHDGSIKCWVPLESDNPIEWYKGSSAVWSVVFCPDGRRLAMSTADGFVQIWDVLNELWQWRTKTHGSPIPALAFSSDGYILVGGGEDANIRVWEASSGQSLGVLNGHMNAVRSLSFNAQGLLASGSDDRTVKLWQVAKAKREASRCLATLDGHQGWVWSVTFNQSGSILASGGHEGVVKLWQITGKGAMGVCVRSLRGFSRLITSIAFNHDGTLLVSGERNGKIRMWETESGKCRYTLSNLVGEAYAVLFHPDGQTFVHSLLDKSIYVRKTANGHCMHTLQGHQGEIWSVAFSPDGRFLVSGSFDMSVKWWSLDHGICLATFHGHQHWIWAVAYSPDGWHLASGDVNGEIKLWNIESGLCTYTLHARQRGIVALTFTADGCKLLASDAQGLISEWDVCSGECLRMLTGNEASYWPGSVSFSPDSSHVMASMDQNVIIWEVEGGAHCNRFLSHVGRPGPVAFGTDQQILAYGTDQGTIVLWERHRGTHLATLCNDSPYTNMNIRDTTGFTEEQRTSLLMLGAVEN